MLRFFNKLDGRFELQNFIIQGFWNVGEFFRLVVLLMQKLSNMFLNFIFQVNFVCVKFVYKEVLIVLGFVFLGRI